MAVQALGDFTKIPGSDGGEHLMKALNIPGAKEVIDQFGFTFGKRFGGGFFSDVFQVESKCWPTKDLLLKIVDYDRCSNKLNYLAELNITKFLRSNKHENLLQIYELIEFDRIQFWILFECFGVVLERFVSSFRDGFPLCHSRHIFKQLVKVVKFIHSHKIVHRDISDTNILIMPGTLQIKLIDFGFSKKISDEFLLEKDKIFCFSNKGTFQFMAPELLHERPFEKLFYDGIKVDIYSMGVVLYYLTYQKYPFKLPDDVDKHDFAKLVSGYYELKNVPKLIPKPEYAYQRLINELLAVNPDDRPSLSVVQKHDFFHSD